METTRRGISELYASMLMVGVTLSFGSVASALAIGQFGSADAASSLSGSVAERSTGTQVSFVFAYVTQTGSCTTFLGAPEGGSLSVILFNYGSTSLTPSLVTVNSTVYAVSAQPILPGRAGTLTVPLAPGACAHPGGQAVVVSDTNGDEAQIET